MRLSSLVVIVGFGLSLADLVVAQSPGIQTLTGTLTIRTKGATTAVLGKNPDSSQPNFMFCIDQDRSTPQAIDFSGHGRVVYQPIPMPPMPEGVAISGPEMVAPALAVVAGDGKAWLFVRAGEKPVLPADDPALAKAMTVQVQGLRRTDWAPKNGPRRGTDLEGCLAPGG